MACRYSCLSAKGAVEFRLSAIALLDNLATLFLLVANGAGKILALAKQRLPDPVSALYLLTVVLAKKIGLGALLVLLAFFLNTPLLSGLVLCVDQGGNLELEYSIDGKCESAAGTGHDSGLLADSLPTQAKVQAL